MQKQKSNLKHIDALEMVQALRTSPKGPFEAPFEYHEMTYLRRLRVKARPFYLFDKHVGVAKVEEAVGVI